MSHKCKVYVSKYDIMHMQCHYHLVSLCMRYKPRILGVTLLHMKLKHKEQKKSLIYIDVRQTSENYISLWCFKKIGCKYANYCLITCKKGILSL